MFSIIFFPLVFWIGEGSTWLQMSSQSVVFLRKWTATKYKCGVSVNPRHSTRIFYATHRWNFVSSSFNLYDFFSHSMITNNNQTDNNKKLILFVDSTNIWREMRRVLNETTRHIKMSNENITKIHKMEMNWCTHTHTHDMYAFSYFINKASIIPTARRRKWISVGTHGHTHCTLHTNTGAVCWVKIAQSERETETEESQMMNWAAKKL